MKKKEREDERIERIIRGLLKLPENRRCINCNSLGPQYVCTTFNTFVCTNCSGIHREFTHRVKSVSMAKFNTEEVIALQAGGNERARQIYFKCWDPQRNSYPESSNQIRLREFIKQFYVERKYAGGRYHENLPRLRMSSREDSYESSRVGSYSGGSPSPSSARYEHSDRYDSGGRNGDRSSKFYYDERSPYSQEHSRSGSSKKGLSYFEIVDDRIRKGRQSDVRRFSDKDYGHESRSPDYRNSTDRSKSPVVRPVKDILGENALSLQVGEHSKVTERKDTNGSAHNQMGTSSGGMASGIETAVKQNGESSQSLIDFDNDSKQSNAAAAPQALENHPSNGEGKISSHDSDVKESMPQPPKPNTIEFLLFELSVPSVAPAANVTDVPNDDKAASTECADGVSSAVPAVQTLSLLENGSASTTASGGNEPLPNPERQMPGLVNSSNASETESASNMFTIGVSPSPSNGHMSTSNFGRTSTTASAGSISNDETAGNTLSLFDCFNAATTPAIDNAVGSTVKVPHEQQQVFITEHHQPDARPAPDDSSTAQSIGYTAAGAINGQLFTSLDVTSVQGPSSASNLFPSQDASQSAQNYSSSEVKSHFIPKGTLSSARQELPEDLFTTSYSAAFAPIPGWQSSPTYGMGYNMQYYPNAMPIQPSSHQAKSTNPFDFSDTTTSAQPFPSMGNLHGALPNISAPGFLPHSSAGYEGLMTTQSPSYASAVPLRSNSFASGLSSGAFMGYEGQLFTPPPGRQGADGFGNDPSNSLNVMQHLTRGHSLPTMAGSQPGNGGNPFQ